MGVFAMPSLGADMEAGKLVEWSVKPGDTVKRGDIVAVVETQKGAIEIETFEEGVVAELTAELGQQLPVGAPMAVILKPGEQAPKRPAKAEAAGEKPPAHVVPPEEAAERDEPAEATATPVAERAVRETEPPPETAPPPAPPPAALPAAGGAAVASPAARVRARELGLDLSTLKGSGPGGVIVLSDVEGPAPPDPAPSPMPPPGRAAAALPEMRRAIAAAMARSKRTIPHFYLSQTIDVEPAMRFLERRNADVAPAERMLLGAVFVRAATLAAAKVPVMNGHYSDEDGFQPSRTVNPGVAVALRGGGLVAPALMDAASMTLEETMAGLRDLVARARAGRLRSSEMTMGTITVSSLGETGAEEMTGVIFPPQVALVGLGAPHLRPWVVEGAIVPRHVVTLTVSADHRVSDGRQAARFVAAFEQAVQTPEEP
ncbi:dihydrolipoamide acetyltransferase family protein [Roseibacterium sp. SDUM158017]|uniref:dihydrolipoamide acetyltransferase family protein n=1 Tax=Roseicyclus salinarum TaxID=3036773 RepID=UPI00241506E6|nr:dihydrolipoamide acetyltransferase family protein [Roseibacterium sp. SDUM158017]MDG4647841.1 dihydrolipoamide acetyltransferase family protein [Roseibacterium sp. SDUM158017]